MAEPSRHPPRRSHDRHPAPHRVRHPIRRRRVGAYRVGDGPPRRSLRGAGAARAVLPASAGACILYHLPRAMRVLGRGRRSAAPSRSAECRVGAPTPSCRSTTSRRNCSEISARRSARASALAQAAYPLWATRTIIEPSAAAAGSSSLRRPWASGRPASVRSRPAGRDGGRGGTGLPRAAEARADLRGPRRDVGRRRLGSVQGLPKRGPHGQSQALGAPARRPRHIRRSTPHLAGSSSPGSLLCGRRVPGRARPRRHHLRRRNDSIRRMTGSSTVIRRIDHPEIDDAVRLLVATLGCSGFVSFDFLTSPSGPSTLIEMNARTVGSGHLGVRFGHDIYGRWLAAVSRHAWERHGPGPHRSSAADRAFSEGDAARPRERVPVAGCGTFSRCSLGRAPRCRGLSQPADPAASRSGEPDRSKARAGVRGRTLLGTR